MTIASLLRRLLFWRRKPVPSGPYVVIGPVVASVGAYNIRLPVGYEPDPDKLGPYFEIKERRP